MPTLIIHGDTDNIVPFPVSGQKAHELVASSELVVLKGAPHGITVTHPDEVTTALLDFLKK
ncbi:MAG: hypothetical protein NVS1B7_4640 [Candidatus Saccharimonadales bacterium]